MVLKAPEWNIFAMTVGRDAGLREDLSNALLYADHVEWSPLELPAYGAMYNVKAELGLTTAEADLLENEAKLFENFEEAIAGDILRPIFTSSDILASPNVEALLDRLEPGLLKDCKSIVLSRDFKAQPIVRTPHALTFELQTAISRLLLPDITGLPVNAILELRDRLEKILNPMRAELLRMTEDLRLLVEKSDLSENAVKIEAERLVATRIEPIVREAAHEIQLLSDRKWRSFMKNVAGAFGFAGASFINPSFVGKAVQKTLEAGALAVGDVEDKRPGPKMTAQFVLEAHRFITEGK